MPKITPVTRSCFLCAISKIDQASSLFAFSLLKTVSPLRPSIFSINTSTKVLGFSPNIEDPTSTPDDTDVKVNIIASRDYSKSSYSKMKKNIYVYSFCLNPEEHQPSGTCNFSSFDDCKLNFTSNVSIDTIFAMNYNILRISNGLVSLRFTN